MRAIHMADFGEDHWLLLMYLEQVCVDDHGDIDARKMRSYYDDRFAPASQPSKKWKKSMSTKQRDGTLVDGHDAWDCLQELRGAGWILSQGDEGSGGRWLTNTEVEMTQTGWRVAGWLRQHKASGQSLKDFNLAQTLLRELNGPRA